MIDLDQWQITNELYLSHAVQWLRLQLSRLAPDVVAASPRDADIDQAAIALRDLANSEVPPAAVMLGQRLGLSSFELSVLLLCAAMELDTRVPALCAQAQDNPHRPYPTFALAMVMFDDPAWDALSPERPLRYWHLLEVTPQADQSLTGCPLRIDERIANYLKGLNHIDSRLHPFLFALGDADTQRSVTPPASQAATKDQIVRYLTTGVDSPPVIQLIGSDSGSKQIIAQQAANELGLLLYRLPVPLLPTLASELDPLVRLWQRETALLPLALYLDVPDAKESDSQAESTSLNRFLARHRGVTFVALRETRADLGASSITVEVHRPTPTEQRDAWRQVGSPGTSADELAGQFDLNLPDIAQIGHLAQATGGDLWQACLAYTRPRMDTLAQRIDAKATWQDLVLPDDELALLHQMAQQVRQRRRVYDDWGFRERMNRGLGISALFAGESGTGKTMAAEVLANDLHLNLYRIDLSAVVSKYIGETEKNLRRLFDAAEGGGAILFFDEADALFGKRSEVKDSHDRYANIEINYLLQRMEAYHGLAILATNMKSALDPAFMRRLRFAITFPFPTNAERQRIWGSVFPRQTPRADLDYAQLARLTLTGGSIHNVAINAAFLAADADTPVNMPLILQAARAEFRKIGRPVNEAELRWPPSNGTGAGKDR